ncbi:zinc ribbon domain-containing protein [Clostridium sp.]|uniref:zinc ribbon domain-containing protein n=1 Tax=Clostridium sp. TaxID=1506 RepID=UPI0025BB1D34|nr:zinc ribbon domain-containing protein [Clostridium sp.]
MALIKCTECGKEVSDKAASCPNCGCPLSQMVKGGTVRIRIPNNIAVGVGGIFASRSAVITDGEGKVLWEGRHGDTAIFRIDEPVEITVDLGSFANETIGKVEPMKRYTLVQDMGMHWKATYRITEVDIIDAD